MATVGRLQLPHPALGASGGAGLHTTIEGLWEKVGNNTADRWFSLTDFDQTETVDLFHNFSTDIENLRYDIYIHNGTEYVLATDISKQLRSDFSVVEKTGSESTTLQITNNTAGNDLLVAVVITNDSIALRDGDVKDVQLSSPTNGQVLTYETASKKFKNQNAQSNKDFTKYLGSGETYTTWAGLLAALTAGDSVLITSDISVSGDVNINVADVRLELLPGKTLTFTGSLTNGLRITQPRVRIQSFKLKFEPTGTQARGLSVEAADAWVDCTIELNTAQTLTDAVHVTSGGSRTRIAASILATLGTITNGVTNNDGASSVSVWG